MTHFWTSYVLVSTRTQLLPWVKAQFRQNSEMKIIIGHGIGDGGGVGDGGGIGDVGGGNLVVAASSRQLERGGSCLGGLTLSCTTNNTAHCTKLYNVPQHCKHYDMADCVPVSAWWVQCFHQSKPFLICMHIFSLPPA